MRPRDIGYVFRLEGAGIDEASEKIQSFLTELQLERKEVLRLKLSAENILITWQEKFGRNTEARLSCYSRLGQPLIRLTVSGDPFDPLTAEEDEFSEWGQRMLARLETRPLYQYSRGTNTVTFRLKRKTVNPFKRLLIAIAAAVAVGLVGQLLPEDFTLTAANNWLGPISNTYLSFMGFVGIPLIFLSVCLGILNVGDIHAFERIGKVMVRKKLLTLLLITLGAALFAFPFFQFTFGNGGISLAYTDLLSMILGWIPDNIINPFISCSAMQLILMGLIFGVALLKLDPLAKTLANFLDDLNNLLLTVSEWASHLIPIFVFLILVKSLWAGESAAILQIYKPLLITITAICFAFFGMLLYTGLRYKVRIITLIKKVSATFLIAFGTNSCVASIMENYNCCAGKLGQDNKVFGFGIPVGTSIFKPAAAIRFVVLSFFVASAYQVAITPSWFGLVILMAFVLSIAVPAIPGGILMFCPMLFAQLGLPAEALAAVLATDIFFDAFCTGINQVAVSIALVDVAGSTGMLNKELLKKEM